ncbi:MAG TPA: hypothetical protein VEI73_09395 [Candidatus Acidoferrum sp.]|nr:hypothetical protein [Candidatus Acidoferrum sp.]
MSKFFRILLCTIVPFAWPAAFLLAQSQSPSQQTPPQQSQTSSQTQSQPAPSTQSKDTSVADAAKKSTADKPKPKKVYTEDDLSGMGKGGVSVVGSGNKNNSRRTPTGDSDGSYAPNGEEYWRSRSQPLLDAIAATDAQIDQLKEDIKKFGNGGFDVQTGRQNNVAYIQDRNGQIQTLEKRKADLKKQLDDLEEEGRKAGAQPAWFR